MGVFLTGMEGQFECVFSCSRSARPKPISSTERAAFRALVITALQEWNQARKAPLPVFPFEKTFLDLDAQMNTYERLDLLVWRAYSSNTDPKYH